MALVCFLFFTILSEGEVIISEFQASNGSTLDDEDGDSSDWIEIHNPTDSEANLTGYYLTDDENDPRKWTFPATTLEPGAYLVVFASSKDRAVAGAELHTNFGLSSGGEYLALVKPDGVTTATEFAPEYPAIPTDVSYGISEFGLRFFEPASPGVSNDSATSFVEFVEELDFSSERGIYGQEFTLMITSSTEDSTIIYTVDGTEPSATAGTVYTTPLEISETTVVRAIAIKEGLRSTESVSHSYIFPTDVVNQSEMRSEITDHPIYGPKVLQSLSTVPTISLSFEGDDIDREEIPLSVEMINFGSDTIQVNAGAVRFGGFNVGFEKRSFRLHFRSRYGPSRLEFPLFDNQDYNIPAVETFDSLDVRAGNHDMVYLGAYLGNPFADDSIIAMGHVAPHGRFVNIYFNGEYRGMYHLRERWSAAMLADYLPGEEEEYDTIDANNNGRLFDIGELEDGDLDDWNEIQDRLDQTPRFEQVRGLLDLNNYVDFMILFTYGTCEAEHRAGGSVENGIGFKFFLKDADGFLQPPTPIGNNLPPRRSDVLDSLGNTIRVYPAHHDGPLDAMRLLLEEEDSDFMILLADRIHRQLFNDGALTTAASSARFTQRREECRLPYFSEIARWQNHGGIESRTPEEWEEYNQFFIDTEFVELIELRVRLFREQNMYPSIDAPSFSQHGGELTANGQLDINMPENASKVYYVTGAQDTNPDIYENSLDPRLPGGVLNPSAQLLTSSDSINLTKSSWILARSFNESTGEWSALNEAFFTIPAIPADASNLVISKIHYNPAAPTSAELLIDASFESDDFEFLELMNVGSEPIDLVGVTISRAVTFDFGENNILAPSSRLILTEDRDAFEVRYASSSNTLQFGTNTSGSSQWSGGLSSGGEQLIVTDASGSVIHDFVYDDVAPWPTAPDGGGYSLVLRNPGLPIPDHAYGRNWAASAEVGGSPGGDNTTGFVGDPNTDNDNDGLSALLEYALGTSDDVAGSNPLSIEFREYSVDGEIQRYFTAVFLVNQHAFNVFDIEPELSNDLITWESSTRIVLVSEEDNNNGTSTVTYRSTTAEEENIDEREFIRIKVEEAE